MVTRSEWKQQIPQSAVPSGTAQTNTPLPPDNKHRPDLIQTSESPDEMCTPALNNDDGNRATTNDYGIDFSYIRTVCESDNLECDVDLSPSTFAEHRCPEWPTEAFGPTHQHYAKIYNAVASTGIPNAIGSRIILPTMLNIPAWELYLAGYDDTLLDYVKYGFPMGYVGPVSDTASLPNHLSATQFPDHVDAFIQKEMSLGGLVGPFTKTLFVEWCHVSPIMKRQKANMLTWTHTRVSP